jgi:hypothetical protein
MPSHLVHQAPCPDPILSQFRSATDAEHVHDAPLSAIAKRIRSAELAERCTLIRQAFAAAGGGHAGKAAISAMKKPLPAITIAGTFTRRANDHWIAASDLVGIDLDDLPPERLENAWQALVASPHVALLYRSPSGAGLKGAVRVPTLGGPDPTAYATAWRAVGLWLASLGCDNDPAVKDVSRLAFLAHDPEAHLNLDSVPLDVVAWTPAAPVDPQPTEPSARLRPGDDFNRREDITPVLCKHGWTLDHVASDGNQHWRRPGKMNGTSATLKDGVFYVFSSSAAPFAANQGYSPFSVFALLEHGGDFTAAASVLRAHGFGETVTPVAESLTSTTAPRIILRTHADRLRDRHAPRRMVIHGVLPAGGVGALVAMPGGGKTLVGIEAARCVAAGDGFAGRATLPGQAVYYCTDAPASTERRMLAMPATIADRILTVTDSPKLPDGLDDLRAVITQRNAAGNDPVRLVVIDTYDSTRSHADGGWAGQDGLTETIMSGLRTLARDLDLGVLVIHHATRADHGRARGSVVFDARLDFIGLVSGDGKHITVTAIKNRDGEAGPIGRFRISTVDVAGQAEPMLVANDGDVATTEVAMEDRVLHRLVAHGGPSSIGGLGTALGIKGKGPIQRALARLRENGLLIGYEPTPAGRERIDQQFWGFTGDQEEATSERPNSPMPDPPGTAVGTARPSERPNRVPHAQTTVNTVRPSGTAVGTI